MTMHLCLQKTIKEEPETLRELLFWFQEELTLFTKAAYKCRTIKVDD